MEPIQAEGVADGADLIDEGVHDPESEVVRMVRLAAAQLVVENDRAPGLGQDRQILQVVVRNAGTAMEDEQGKPPARSGRVAQHLVPRPVAAEQHSPLRHRHH